MGTRAAPGVLAHQLAQIEFVYDFNDEAGQVILGQPLINRRRKQTGGVSVNVGQRQ